MLSLANPPGNNPVWRGPVPSRPQFRGELIPRPEAAVDANRFYPARPNPAVIWASRQLAYHLAARPLNFKLDIAPADVRRLAELRQSGNSLIITPNHASWMDFLVVTEMGRQAGMDAVGMGAIELFESRHLGLVWPIKGRILQRMGIFSVNRAARNKDETLAAAKTVLEENRTPLLIFPEGHVSWTNRTVTSLKTGAARNAIDLARRGHPVKIVPLAIYYDYPKDIGDRLVNWIDRLESQVQDRRRKEPDLPELPIAGQDDLPGRIGNLFGWVVAEREQRYGIRPGESTGDPDERLSRLVMEMLADLESKYGVPANTAIDPELRIRRLIGVVAEKRAPKPKRLPVVGRVFQKPAPLDEAREDLKVMKDLLVLTFYAPDYLAQPDQGRMLEMLVQLERDITGEEPPFWKIARDCTARVRVMPPIDVAAFLAKRGMTGGDDSAAALTSLMAQRLQTGIDDLARNA